MHLGANLSVAPQIEIQPGAQNRKGYSRKYQSPISIWFTRWGVKLLKWIRSASRSHPSVWQEQRSETEWICKCSAWMIWLWIVWFIVHLRSCSLPASWGRRICDGTKEASPGWMIPLLGCSLTSSWSSAWRTRNCPPSFVAPQRTRRVSQQRL